MSFAYLPLFTGDYLRDTRHLTPLRHGIYLLGLMHCWDSKGPMPLDEQECAGICNCRSADEIEALRYVLGKYFVQMDDGHYNKRMSEIVAHSEMLSKQRSDGAIKGAQIRRDKAREGARTKDELKLRTSLAQAKDIPVSPSPSPSPSPSLIQIQENTIEATPLVQKPVGFSPPPCPTQEIVDAYRKHLPALPQPNVLNAARKTAISARWREVCVGEKFTREQGLEWFDWFFSDVARSKFLTGRAASSHRRPFRATLDWLMAPTNFAKAVDGNYRETA